MDDTGVFAQEAADVAMQAIKEGVARLDLTWDEVYETARRDIAASRALTKDMERLGYIKEPPMEMLEKALGEAVAAIRAKNKK